MERRGGREDQRDPHAVGEDEVGELHPDGGAQRQVEQARADLGDREAAGRS